MIDWLGMGLTLAGSLSVIRKKRFGFLLMLLGCLAWIGFGIIVESMAVIVTNIVFSGVNAFGYYKWKKDDEKN